MASEWVLKETMRICVIIPQFNKPEMTAKCVELTRQNAGINHDILVVDDGSEDKYSPGLNGENLLRLDENSGYTNATNQGILWCKDRYDYIHLLNNDTEPEPDFLKLLYEAMEADKAIGIAASARIISDDNKEGSYNIENYGQDLIRGYQICTTEDIKEPIVHTHWVPLCSALIRHSVIREIGLLDKRMRIWSSDLDYCLRVNFAGYNVSLVSKSKVKHLHGVTTKTVASKYKVEDDQRVLLQKLAGLQYAELMTKLPLDAESNTYGKLDFLVYKR